LASRQSVTDTLDLRSIAVVILLSEISSNENFGYHVGQLCLSV